MEKVRYNNPSRYDKAPYGFITCVKTDNGNSIYWIQMSKDKEHSEWVSIGDVLCCIYEHKFDKESFITELLNEYERRNKNKAE